MLLEEALADIVQSAKQRFQQRPLVVGVCGPQACGKTTACIELCERLGDAVHLSLDDFYLPFEELEELYKQTGFDPLYRFRGNAGSHNTTLLQQVLQTLKAGHEAIVPVFDKTLRNGYGDVSGSRTVKPADIIILEGWLVGFKPHQNVPSNLANVNRFLGKYDGVTQLVDVLIVIKVKDVESVVRMWRSRAPGIPENLTADFLRSFEPAYGEYYSTVITDFDGLATYVLSMEADRTVRVEF